MTHCVPQFWTKMSSLMWYLFFVTLITSRTVSANESSTLDMKVSSCNITGVWSNELGSTLRVKAEGSEVRGVYQTAVESKRGAAGLHRTAQIIGVVGNGTQPAVSFSVLWEKGSCSAWLGQCFILRDGEQVLKTFWMLRSVADNLAGDWGSTRLGEDLFFKT
ncbi:avidin [Sinocyclocheilus grahami]|uniref:Avidin-like n=1 Tax=Sinocyclocheilus grahami TaxID=75366 RepID=A0A672TET0_SINGR|nr:PREDICTED: avidin-like [Sinocyclocheilus grahami]